MSRIIIIKNNTGVEYTIVGKVFAIGESYQLIDGESEVWGSDDEVFTAISSGDIIVNNGTSDITSEVEAWNWIQGDTLPMSELGNKLAIHSSTKPAIPGKEMYLVWTGAGDLVGASPQSIIGGGDPLFFDITTGVPEVTKVVDFAPEFGDVYIHEGYLKWDGAGKGDYLTARVISEPTQLQTVANLDLTVTTDNWVIPASGGAGTGTHGFAATPVLIKRTKSKDGEWDYDSVNGLQPNVTATGLYKISTIARNVHQYINRIPMYSNSYGYTRLTSDETAYLPNGYHLEITVYNKSNTNWSCSVFMEVFRERTSVP